MMKPSKTPIVLFFICVVLLGLIVWLTVAKPDFNYSDGFLGDRLAGAEAKWRSQPVANYRIVMRLSAGMYMYPPVTYTVRAGKIVEKVVEESKEYPNIKADLTRFEQTEPVAGLFALAKSELERARANPDSREVKLTFDDHGFPNYIWGSSLKTFDANYCWRVTSFAVLDP